jgi:hypothetical protein
MDTQTIIMIAAFWSFVGSLGFGVFAFMRFLSDPNNRDSRGLDVSTEVGYETDAYGRRRAAELDGATESPSGVPGDMPMDAPHQGQTPNF